MDIAKFNSNDIANHLNMLKGQSNVLGKMQLSGAKFWIHNKEKPLHSDPFVCLYESTSINRTGKKNAYFFVYN